MLPVGSETRADAAPSRTKRRGVISRGDRLSQAAAADVSRKLRARGLMRQSRDEPDLAARLEFLSRDLASEQPCHSAGMEHAVGLNPVEGRGRPRFLAPGRGITNGL